MEAVGKTKQWSYVAVCTRQQTVFSFIRGLVQYAPADCSVAATGRMLFTGNVMSMFRSLPVMHIASETAYIISKNLIIK